MEETDSPRRFLCRAVVGKEKERGTGEGAPAMSLGGFVGLPGREGRWEFQAENKAEGQELHGLWICWEVTLRRSGSKGRAGSRVDSGLGRSLNTRPRRADSILGQPEVTTGSKAPS